MKYIKLLSILIISIFMLQNCADDEVTTSPTEPDFSGVFSTADQMGRPAVNTVFVSSDMKDDFNETPPSQQGAKYASAFANRLRALSPTYETADDRNLLGLNAEEFGGVLATDVLTVSLDGVTTFFDGTNVLTGRALTDDVITVELILIFGGEMGDEIPTLSDDNVDNNDKAFLTAFPYLATPW